MDAVLPLDDEAGDDRDDERQPDPQEDRVVGAAEERVPEPAADEPVRESRRKEKA